MKFFAFLSILAVVLVCLLFDSVNTEPASGDGREPVCDLGSFPKCPRIFEPVCGTDGETYSNECLLCLEKKTKVQLRIIKNGKC